MADAEESKGEESTPSLLCFLGCHTSSTACMLALGIVELDWSWSFAERDHHYPALN
jgi:hypothetical protein